MEIDYCILGENVRKFRKQRMLSQEQLAELCDISTSFLGHIERGTRKMSLETLVSLADVLHVTPDSLLSGQLPVHDASLISFLNGLTFDSPTQKQRFYNAIRALAKGRDLL